MASGQFWVWNSGEPPVWGASAPFWPLLLAAGIAGGVAPLIALQGCGFVLGLLAMTGTAALLVRNARPVPPSELPALLCFVGFGALDSTLCYHMTSGLESPLTLLLLTFGLYALQNPRWLGLALGALLVHKVDLIPAGMGLLAGDAWTHGRVRRGAVGQALVVASMAYGAAWLYFGSPLPLPFWTKLVVQGEYVRIIGGSWFAITVLAAGAHRWLTLLIAVGGLTRQAERWGWLTRPQLWGRPHATGETGCTIFLVSILASHLAAYSVWPPFEPYSWYAVPASWALIVLGAREAARLPARLEALAGPRVSWPAGLSTWVVGLGILGLQLLHLPEARQSTATLLDYVARVEVPRAKIGRWLAANTAQDAIVQSPWGLPAWYSGRTVIDGSFLNTRPDTPLPSPDFRVENADAAMEDGWTVVERQAAFVVWARTPSGVSP